MFLTLLCLFYRKLFFVVDFELVVLAYVMEWLGEVFLLVGILVVEESLGDLGQMMLLNSCHRLF